MEEEKTVTTDHQAIKNWAEKFNGCPEMIFEPGTDVPIGLRINFPTKRDDIYLSSNRSRRDISWREFFTEFERMDLAFEYQNKDVNDPSLSYMFVKRNFMESGNLM